MKKPRPRTELIECSCFIEGLRLVKFEDDDDDLYLSMWADKHYVHPVPWKQRLRNIWRIIRKGDPFEDELILSTEAQADLVRFLLNAPGDATVFWQRTSSDGVSWSWTASGATA